MFRRRLLLAGLTGCWSDEEKRRRRGEERRGKKREENGGLERERERVASSPLFAGKLERRGAADFWRGEEEGWRLMLPRRGGREGEKVLVLVI